MTHRRYQGSVFSFTPRQTWAIDHRTLAQSPVLLTRAITNCKELALKKDPTCHQVLCDGAASEETEPRRQKGLGQDRPRGSWPDSKSPFLSWAVSPAHRAILHLLGGQVPKQML